MRPPSVITIGVLLAAMLSPQVAMAQTDTQLWANVTLTWIKSRDLTLGVDTEPKVLLSAPPGEPGWAALDVTPSIEYTRNRWFDVLGELKLGRTRQSDDLDSTEVTPRVGVRLHILSNLLNALAKEKEPRRRLVLRDVIRFEWRHLYYSGTNPDSSTERLRNRFDMLYPVTRARITDDGATYLRADVEWFWTRSDLDERFANKQRIRAGVGYRRSFAWRFDALYVWDRSRNSADEGFTTADHAIDLGVQRVW